MERGRGREGFREGEGRREYQLIRRNKRSSLLLQVESSKYGAVFNNIKQDLDLKCGLNLTIGEKNQ